MNTEKIEQIKSRFRTKTVVNVDYNDIDRLINEYFETKDFECVAYEEWGNYESHEFSLDGIIADYDKKDLEKFLATKDYQHYSTRCLLNYLVSQNVIPEGDYVISIYW